MRLITMFIALCFILPATAVLAGPSAEKEGHLIITEVSVDYGTSSMVIIGYDLDFGDGPLAVILGDTDISADCALDLPLADPQTITCVNLALPVAAELLLVVSNGNGASQIDEYDLTFGAVGPQGEIGPQGDTGAQGPQGPPGPVAAIGTSCPSGQAVIGMNIDGTFICEQVVLPCPSGQEFIGMNIDGTFICEQVGLPRLCSEVATEICEAKGWTVVGGALGGNIVCTIDGRDADLNCSSCSEYNIAVWENGSPERHCPGSYSTLAGQVYGGHIPCTCSDNLYYCEEWDMQNCIPD